MFDLQLKQDLEPTKTWQRQIKQTIGSAAATAQTFYIDIPRDSFIHEITIRCAEDILANNPGSRVDKIADIKLVGNGNKYFKDAFGLAGFFVEVEKVNYQRHVTGIYKLTFSDPLIDEAKPLPAWMLTSLQLIITDTAPAATMYRFLDVTLTESAYDPVRHGNLSDWKLLIEKVTAWKKWGTNTGWCDYEHEKAYKIFSYVYASDDNATLGDAVFDKLKVVGRNPKGEIIVTDELFWDIIKQQCSGTSPQDPATGFIWLQWAKGFPTTDFSSLYSKLNIKTAGTNKAVRVLERYLL